MLNLTNDQRINIVFVLMILTPIAMFIVPVLLWFALPAYRHVTWLSLFLLEMFLGMASALFAKRNIYQSDSTDRFAFGCFYYIFNIPRFVVLGAWFSTF